MFIRASPLSARMSSVLWTIGWPMPLLQRFGEYVTSSEHLLPSLFWSMCKSDVVFDCYLPNSIKGGTRSKDKEGKSRGHCKECEEWEQGIGDWLNTFDFEIKNSNIPNHWGKMKILNYVSCFYGCRCTKCKQNCNVDLLYGSPSGMTNEILSPNSPQLALYFW